MLLSKTSALPCFWQEPLADLLERLQTRHDGLSNTEAADRLSQFGPNLVRGSRKGSIVSQLLKKFRNPLVIILMGASGLAALTGDTISFLIIAAIVLVSVLLDFAQYLETATQPRPS